MSDRVDPAAVTAIDMHVHCEISADGRPALPQHLQDGARRFFGDDTGPLPSIDDTAGYYRERDLAAVIFTIDIASTFGHDGVSNVEIADAAARHPDVLIPFASIDPARGVAGIAEARRLVVEHGVRGFKFHPNLQAFQPNDRAAYPLYEAITDLGVPALFHSGQSGIGAGLRGGGGIRLKHSNPLLLDDVAVDFPDLQIIIAHPSFPWQDEALAVAVHKPNVWLDLSGWSPKYFPPQLVRFADTMLRDRVLFGSDHPFITPDRWLRDFEDVAIRDEVRPGILKHNAARLLGLRS
ncbi:MAG TPA: amidohydrolase family protein [Euzebyales bacterium]|nr:amidohydrolase family protein [Euzebyales bacterium]